MAGDFVAGADLSHLAFFETRGVSYRDAGRPGDALEILQAHGLNCVRLRLFTSSSEQALADPYNYINNLDYTLPLAVRVKQAHLKLLLDFHFSDTWADPGHQLKPNLWTNLGFLQLVQQLRSYTSNCISIFGSAGAMPDYVQIGNEITAGVLWPEGSNQSGWSQFGQLLRAARLGVLDASPVPPPLIIIHIDRGGDWATTQWFFDNLNQQQVPFDIIGQSYYPYWHGPLSALSNCLRQAAQRYDKPVMLIETDFPWTNSTPVYGLPATPEGQVDFLTALAQIVKSVPGQRGAGILWWGAEYQSLPASGINLGGFQWRSCFDNQGDLLPVASALGALTAPLLLQTCSSPTGVQLSWPLSGAGFTLTSATRLAPSEIWLPATNAVNRTGLLFRVFLPLSPQQACFFRLRSN